MKSGDNFKTFGNINIIISKTELGENMFRSVRYSSTVRRFQNISVEQDSSADLENYEPKLKVIGNKLDSLSLIQEKITNQLDSLKQHTNQIKKEQRQSDLINGGILILFVIIIIKILLSRWKKN